MTPLGRLTIVAALGVAVIGAPPPAGAQRGRAQVREGNRLYAERRYDEAHQKYLDALRRVPNSPVIRFNDGDALYQQGELERALNAYRDAVEHGDSTLQAKAWYNLGNAFYRSQQLEQSIEAYKQALRRDPNDVDAKHNLELALRRQQQQQQQNQQQQNQQQQDQQQQDQRRQNQQRQDQQQQEQQQQQRDQQPQDQQQQDQRQQDQQRQDQQPQNQDQAQRDGEQGNEDQQREQPSQGEMSREEAERLLRAVREDPDEIQRQRRATAPHGRPPRKEW